ncbi:MAG: TIGR00730 family Rossman fold protein [Ignavibacteriaceae bacterium]|nr:TIGR00730 family Rossman fold protein [Ignavibacteriaceae bacterium]
MKNIKTPKKAYSNPNFLNSPDARTLRILAEYLEPESRFNKYKIMDTVVFFGSARLISRRAALREYAKIKNADPKQVPGFALKLRKAQQDLIMSKYYDDAVELSKRLTEWSLSLGLDKNRFIMCTGGGPGIMEAANKGAKQAGGYSIGLNISIPFEQFVNQYVTPQLKFEFHYFFMRKFWFAYLSKALIIFPGGFGTMDELFEILTLVQTGKIKKNLMILIYDEKYWKDILNFDKLAEYGMINKSDLNLFQFCNSIDDAFEIVKRHFEKFYLKRK